jgi:branched-chain amino acid transport system permease protein
MTVYYTATPRRVTLDLGVVEIGSIVMPVDRLLGTVLALLLTGLLYLVMRRSRIGRAIVAVRMDSAAAALMGIRVNRIYAITFGIGALMAGVTGVIFAMVYPVTTNLTGTYLGKAFVVCVIGGLGSVPGALVGGIVLGVIESFSGQFFGPQHALTVGFVLMLVLLVVKPTGLTGIKGYE